MEALGLVEKRRYRERPRRQEYALSAAGRELLPVRQEMCRFANHHVTGTWAPPADFMKRAAHWQSAEELTNGEL